MPQKKEHLEGLLKLIDVISKEEGNGWFVEELTKRFGSQGTGAGSDNLALVGNALNGLRGVLELRGDPSIDYSFVAHEHTREQLILDNLRMENVRFDVREANHQSQFYKYCVYAFYQVENLMNYFYARKFSGIQDIISFISKNCKQSKNFSYNPSPKHKTVGDIEISYKISAFCNLYTDPNEAYDFFLVDIKGVRNENAHRCSVLTTPENDMPKFYNSFKKYGMDMINVKLTRFVAEVERALNQSI